MFGGHLGVDPQFMGTPHAGRAVGFIRAPSGGPAAVRGDAADTGAGHLFTCRSTAAATALNHLQARTLPPNAFAIWSAAWSGSLATMIESAGTKRVGSPPSPAPSRVLSTGPAFPTGRPSQRAGLCRWVAT